MKRLWNIIKSTLYFFYNFSGLRHLWENIICPIDKDTKKWKPSTFIIWVIGLYVALFGIASQRYENRVDLIEIRISSVFTQLSTPLYKRAFSRIAETQQLPCPLKPDIKNPITVYQSLFNDTIYFEGVDLLKTTVENWKDSLSNVDLKVADLRVADLRFADLRFADLSGANLNGAILMYADLRFADLIAADLSDAKLPVAFLKGAVMMGADLSGADLRFAVLSDADLRVANLTEADLTEADLSGANLREADLSGACMDGANLSGADIKNTLNLEKDQLSRSYYIDDPPINLPEGIDPPLQFEEWKKLIANE